MRLQALVWGLGATGSAQTYLHIFASMCGKGGIPGWHRFSEPVGRSPKRCCGTGPPEPLPPTVDSRVRARTHLRTITALDNRKRCVRARTLQASRLV